MSIRVSFPGVHSKRMYDAPRFQEDRLRPRGSSTVQADSRGPTHC